MAKAGFDFKEATKSVNGVGSATIVLGEREYVITERKRQAQADWRKRFENAFESVSDLVVMMLKQIDKDIPGLKAAPVNGNESAPDAAADESNVSITTAEEREQAQIEAEQAQMAEAKGFLISLLARANNLVSGVLDEALELVVSYSPSLTADRDYILTEVYDSQIVDALVEVLQLAYPFGSLINQLGKMGKLKGTGSAQSKT